MPALTLRTTVVRTAAVLDLAEDRHIYPGLRPATLQWPAMLVAESRFPAFEHALSRLAIWSCQCRATSYMIIDQLGSSRWVFSSSSKICFPRHSSCVLLEMGLLKSLVSSRERDVDCSDSGSDDFLPPPARLQTIYSGISVSFTAQVTLPQRTGMPPFCHQHLA